MRSTTDLFVVKSHRRRSRRSPSRPRSRRRRSDSRSASCPRDSQGCRPSSRLDPGRREAGDGDGFVGGHVPGRRVRRGSQSRLVGRGPVRLDHHRGGEGRRIGWDGDRCGIEVATGCRRRRRDGVPIGRIDDRRGRRRPRRSGCRSRWAARTRAVRRSVPATGSGQPCVGVGVGAADGVGLGGALGLGLSDGLAVGVAGVNVRAGLADAEALGLGEASATAPRPQQDDDRAPVDILEQDRLRTTLEVADALERGQERRLLRHDVFRAGHPCRGERADRGDRAVRRVRAVIGVAPGGAAHLRQAEDGGQVGSLDAGP